MIVNNDDLFHPSQGTTCVYGRDSFRRYATQIGFVDKWRRVGEGRIAETNGLDIHGKVCGEINFTCPTPEDQY
jgi:hypothetical protein